MKTLRRNKYVSNEGEEVEGKEISRKRWRGKKVKGGDFGGREGVVVTPKLIEPLYTLIFSDQDR